MAFYLIGWHLALSIDSIGLIGGILRVIGLLWCIYLLLCDYMANIWIYWIIYYLNVYVCVGIVKYIQVYKHYSMRYTTALIEWFNTLLTILLTL